MDHAYGELFRSEASEHLAAIDRLLLRLEREPARPELLDELFRSVHTLKGASAAMGLSSAESLAHAMEESLGALRDRPTAPEPELFELLLQAADALGRAITEPEVSDAGAGALVEKLTAGSGATTEAKPAAARSAFETLPDEARVRVRIEAASPMPAVRAFMALNAARAVATVLGCDPPEEEIAAGRLAGDLVLRVGKGADLRALGDAIRRVGEVESVEVGGAAADDDARAKRTRSGPIVRVPQDRLDRLVDQMGELLIARDRLQRAAERTAGDDPALGDALEAASRLIDELREEILRLRMVPVGEAFDRFPRLVRDAARSLGRAVELEVVGGHEEVDRGLLNEVADLLVHLLRNAVDHGIEPPEERGAKGKPPIGRIRLRAAREGATVRIEVADDGRGIDRERVLATARERGLVAPGEEPDEAGVLALLTSPGFSTSERVTGVSGRGVGLDVVRARVRALGGGLEIRSQPGAGSTFALRLPLSLTLIQALRFEAGGAYYSVPIAAVIEVADLSVVDDGAADFRGARVPVLDLRGLLAGGRGADPVDADPSVIVVAFGEECAALLVGGLVGQHQAVVKSIDAPPGAPPIFAGATVLPEGRPSLVLDPARVVALANGMAG